VQINISARHGHLSETTQQKIREKLDHLTRFFERISSIQFVEDLENKEALKVDLHVSAEHKHDFVAHETADELIRAVDGVVQKMEQQLRKYKEKIQNPRAKAPLETGEIGDDEGDEE
jgi:putative sigma-54 modulation protein